MSIFTIFLQKIHTSVRILLYHFYKLKEYYYAKDKNFMG